MRHALALSPVPAVLLPAALCLCGLSCRDNGPGSGAAAPPRQVGTFLGDKAVRILSAPTRVQTFRLVSLDERRGGVPTADSSISATTSPATAPAQLHQWPVSGTGPDQDAAFGARVAAALFNPRSYQFNSAKGCIFDPGVLFRVWSGSEYADMAVCFACDEFQLILPEADGKTRKVGEDFDDNRPAFVRLAKEAFPNDPQIQGLQ